MVAYEPLPFLFIDLNDSSLLVWVATGEGSVNQHQNRVGNCHQGALFTTSCESPEPVFQEAIFLL
jgi:hypothetical protein